MLFHVGSWKSEPVPDADLLYRRIYPMHYNAKTAEVDEAAFCLRPKETSLSVEWQKHTTPQKAVKAPNTKKKFFLVSLFAKDPREIDLDVLHTPGTKKKGNRAHCSIVGINSENESEKSGELSYRARPVIVSDEL